MSAVETDYREKYKYFGFFEIADKFFITVYTMEFLVKTYVDPVGYCKNGYNVFDAVLLVVWFLPVFSNGRASGAVVLGPSESSRHVALCVP